MYDFSIANETPGQCSKCSGSGEYRWGTLVNGKPSKTVNVTSQKLYHLFSAPRVEKHTMVLKFAPGISGYAFTFG